jgi:hypothetical protein
MQKVFDNIQHHFMIKDLRKLGIEGLWKTIWMPLEKTKRKTPKKLDSIYCPQRRKTKADTLKQLSPIGEGDQELEQRLDQE